MTEMTYEELEEWAHQMTRERNKALEDLRDARQAIVGVKEALTQKLLAARLSSRCDWCPLDHEEGEDE